MKNSVIRFLPYDKNVQQQRYANMQQVILCSFYFFQVLKGMRAIFVCAAAVVCMCVCVKKERKANLSVERTQVIDEAEMAVI